MRACVFIAAVSYLCLCENKVAEWGEALPETHKAEMKQSVRACSGCPLTEHIVLAVTHVA